jgi:predicted amidohydrolase YtcJ
MTRHRAAAATLLVLSLAAAASAAAQEPDIVLVNGRIVTLDARSSIQEAIAVRDGRVMALGDTAAIRRRVGPATRVIDLGGRAVIPGLIDSHMHAIRAALSFSTEVNWTGSPSLADAMGRIRDASRRMPAGSWLVVAGGWTEQQFAEKRRPSQMELEAAAPDNPVYVQLGYGWVVMTEEGFKTLGISTDGDLPAGGRLERDARGRPTGAIAGGNSVIVALFDRLPKPTLAQQIEGTRAFFRELNRLGVTGVVDPGGNNLLPGDYQALFDVWQRGEMTVRVAYSLNGQTAGSERDELKALTTLLPMGFGDDMLRFNGIGERITFGMYNNPRPSDADTEQFRSIAAWAAARGMGLTIHWGADSDVDRLLAIFERLNREIPLAPLRWSIAHLNDASERTLTRMKALGIGWTVQDAMYFGGDQFLRQAGREAASRVPPVVTARRLGVPVGAGTDAHRVASYNPFTSLQWFLDGRTVSGTVIRGAAETPDREHALRLYTLGSAWFSHDEDLRGSLEAGKLADLAVLTKDYLRVPVAEVGTIESLLTMVGGRVVYAAGPFTQYEDRTPLAR